MWPNVEFKCLNSIILIVLFCSINAATDRRLEIKVEGIATELITVDKHKDLIITCEADEPIDWIDPWTIFPSLWSAPFSWNFEESRLYMHAAKLNKFDLRGQNDSNGTHQSYKSYLRLKDVDHNSVGIYYCAEKNPIFSSPLELFEDSSNVNFKWIYLSVKDDEFPIKSESQIWIWDSCEIDIPCMSTYHNEQITVKVNNQVVTEPDMSPPKFFRTPNSTLTNKSGNSFQCSKNDGTNVKDIDVHVNFNGSYSCDDSVMITSKTDDFGIEGSTLEFRCVYNGEGAKEFKWILPNEDTANRAKWVKTSGNLIIRDVKKRQDIGAYKCIVTVDQIPYEIAWNITRILRKNETFLNLYTPPEFNLTSKLNVSEELIRVVKYSAYPTPKFTWFDNKGNTIKWGEKKNDDAKKIAYHDPNKKLVILILRDVNIADSGNYSLIADNGKQMEIHFGLKVEDNSRVQVWLIVVMVVGIVMMLFSLCILSSSRMRVQINRDLKRLFWKIVLTDFKPIGAGCFSDVYMAKIRLTGIKVVVKIPKNSARKNEIYGTDQIIQEIKNAEQMKTRHDHVVRTIGYVIGDIMKSEIWIIYELCHYGNMKSFLKKNEKFFINQVERTSTGYKINLEKKLSGELVESTSNSENQTTKKTGDYRKKPEAPIVESNESEINSILTPVGITITTMDILNWLYQLADALTFMVSKNTFHRDLAARNIFLCKDMKIKIGDFGLSRVVREHYTYKNSAMTPEPIAWMAMELRNDEKPVNLKPSAIEKSEVWAFGVVMWEFFACGADPDRFSYEELKNGERLRPPPETMTPQMEDVMHMCWEELPENRPTFAELKDIFYKLISNVKEGQEEEDNEKRMDEEGNEHTSPPSVDDDNDTDDVNSECVLMIASNSTSMIEVESNCPSVMSPLMARDLKTTIVFRNELNSNHDQETKL